MNAKTSLKIHIGLANESDLFMIYLIEIENFGFDFSRRYMIENGYNHKTKTTKCYVYRVKGLTIGYILFNYYKNSEILMLGVKSEFKHQGIGTKLLNKVKQYSDNITLEVRKSNTLAISFYEKNSFILYKVIANYYVDEDGLYYIWKKN